MLQFLKRLFFKDRRYYPRHLINCSFDLVVPTKEGTTIKRKVDVIDISFGGFAFIYEGSPCDLANSGRISLSKGMPATIGFKTVSDVERSEGSTYRRRGAKFEFKSLFAKKQLVEFIEEYGL
jgi:hypothetical protein